MSDIRDAHGEMMSEGLKILRRRILLAFIAASCACVALGQTRNGAARKTSRDEAAVLAADRAWADAIARGDVQMLAELFADDFVIVSPNGDLKNKQQEIANLAPAPDVVTYYFRTEDVSASVYKDAAVVRGRAVWKVKYRGREIDNDRRYTSTYVKRSQRWLLVAQQISGNLPAVAAQAQANPDASSSLEAELMQLQRDEDAAEAKKDLVALDRILADDFIFTAPTGVVSDKKQLIAEIKSDEPEPEQTINYDGVKVYGYGNSAVVNYTLIVKGRDKEGKDYTNRYRNTVVWVRERERWRMAAIHASRVRL